MPYYEDEIHPDAEMELKSFLSKGYIDEMGELWGVLSELIEHGLSPSETPSHPIIVPGGRGLFDRTVSQFTGVFSINQPKFVGGPHVFRVLAIAQSARLAFIAAGNRV